MIIDILNKVLLFLLILSILNVVRNSFFLLQSFREKNRFVLDKYNLIVLGISISYIVLAIIDSIKL